MTQHIITGIRLKEKTKKLAPILTGISHPHRLGILYLLLHKPLQAHDVAMTIDLPPNLVAHHLKIMIDGGWLTKMRIGRTVTYALNERQMRRCIKMLEASPRLRLFLSKNSREEKKY